MYSDYSTFIKWWGLHIMCFSNSGHISKCTNSGVFITLSLQVADVTLLKRPGDTNIILTQTDRETRE